MVAPQNLTIIIPTYNRPTFLRRSIYYWGKSPFRIVIADGSDRPYEDPIPANVTYFHDPSMFVLDRWRKAVEIATGEYAVFCADDDFFGFDALRKCLEFLEQNKDYTSACGRYLSFTIAKSVEVEPIYSHIWHTDICSDLPSTRMTESMNPFMVLIYSVHRIDNFKKAFLSYKYIGNHNLVELHMNLVTSILGKHKVLPLFYSAREKIADSTGTRNTNVLEWIASAENTQKVSKWRNAISELYSSYTGRPMSEGATAFDQAMVSYHKFSEAYRKPKFNWKIKLRPFVPRGLVKLRRTLLKLDQVESKPLNTVANLFSDSEGGRKLSNIYNWNSTDSQQDWKLMEESIIWETSSREGVIV